MNLGLKLGFRDLIIRQTDNIVKLAVASRIHKISYKNRVSKSRPSKHIYFSQGNSQKYQKARKKS